MESAGFSSQEKSQCWESTFHLDSVHFSFSHFCAFLPDWNRREIIEFVLSGVMGFVCETGEALHTPGTGSLSNNPIYTEIEVNKTGTYFPTRKREGCFPMSPVKKFFFYKQERKKNPMHLIKDIPGGLGEELYI